MVLIDGIYSTPVYSLKESYSVKDGNSSFFIDYTSREGILLDIYQGEKKISDINLPGSNSNLHYQVPVLQGDNIEGFRIKSLSRGATAGSFSLLNAGVERTIPGFKVRKTSDSLELIIKDGFIITDSNSFHFDRLSADADRDFNQVQVSVDYDYTGSSKKEYELVIYSKDHEKKFELNARRGGSTIYFYSDSLGFVPAGIRFESTDSDFMVTGIGINSFSKSASPDYSPVPADIGTMLNYNISSWRQDEFEIFSWNLFPETLILEFRDYAVQSASLKRLAFFVEKKGFTGRLLNNETLSRLHGWNAHNYRAKDLAVFFSIAEDRGFDLNPEEYEIMNILLSNKIIGRTDKGFEPLSGSILSYSTESSPRLQYLFITHEGYHGIFFSDLQFAADVEGIWNNLEEAEKNFWYDFLDWKRYEIEDSYLVVNEFMAYLMQQDISQIESYYKNYIIPKYLVVFPEKKEEMTAFFENYPDHFIKNAKAVEKFAFAHDSITAGELRSLH